jgi:hypothetical protein
MDQAATSIYRPRRPERTDLHQIVRENLDLFLESYDERFLDQHGPLTARARRTLDEYLRCGILSEGFARVRCVDCGHELLVAFSCQLRGVCPSCQQKRAEILCRFVIDEIIEPVGHRQLVFVLPRHLRRPFYRDRKLLTGLCRAAVEATHDFYRAGLGRDDLRVGMVVVPQRFGDRVNPHIHLHAMATDGAFDTEGVFHPMPFDMVGDVEVLTRLFAKRVLDLMVRRKRLSRRLRDEMLTWKRSGFSADGSVKVAVGDYGRLKRLVRYLARPAVSAQRVEYDKAGGTVTVRSSKKVQGIRPVVAQYDALTFLSLLALQVPPPGVHMVRYYGHYSVRSRAERRRRAGEGQAEVHTVAPPPSTTRRRSWAQLLRQVFEIEVLRCPKCEAEMKIISFITTSHPQVIRRILDHLGMSTVVPQAHGPPEWLARCEQGERAALSREAESFSQTPPGWDDWEPA